MLASRIIKVQIERTFADVYDFLADPLNFSKWAANPDSGMDPLGGSDWVIDVPRGKVVIRFSPINTFGVLDYQTFPRGADGGPVTPVRLYANGDGSELLLTWFQRPGVSDEAFVSDVEWVTSDLTRLKSLLEST